MLSNLEFEESLPKKRMGAGCLIFYEGGHLLLLKPKYKPVWEIPGGITEQNESPKGCCQREVKEEIGLEHEIGKLLAIDYNSRTEQKTESLMFIFYGGILSQIEIAEIQVQSNEISIFGFFTRETL
ncbi:MAG: NUDIX hydrolase, partial [Anaerolineaceae bacterium]|nr:NUDIX hydrolase [Anaerolineaceae bacterium]